jgi:hypothetical protein
MTKWIWIGLIVGFVVFVLVTGYTGGAKDAAGNYNKVLRQTPSE